MQILVNVEPEWVKQKMGVIVNCDGGHAHQICSFMWADNYGIMSHSKTHLEQIKKDLLEEAEWTCNRHPQASEMTGGHYDPHANREARNTFRDR